MTTDLSILIVEDVEEKRIELIERLRAAFQRLQDQGKWQGRPRFRGVPNAIEAGDWLTRETYDWVVLDAVLGLGETGEQLKQRYEERAKLWIWHSAYKKSLKQGDPHLSKPLDDFELDFKLEGWLISYSK